MNSPRFENESGTYDKAIRKAKSGFHNEVSLFESL